MTRKPIRPRLAPQAFVPPYRPSWFDQFMGWVDRLPGPTWLAYLLLATVSILLFLWNQDRAGSYTGGFFAWHIFFALQSVGCLALMHHLNHLAGNSIQRFAPAIGNQPAALAEARYRLTHLPPITAFLGGVGGTALILGYLMQGAAAAIEMRVAFTSVFIVYTLVLGWVYGVLAGFVIHTARTIRAIYARTTSVDIFHPDAMYAFAPLAARTAIGLAAITFGWSVGQPTNFSDPLSLLNAIFALGLAIVVFVSPLWGAHRILVEAKRHALGENASRFRAAAIAVHRRLDSGRTAGMDDLNRALSNLEMERAHLTRATTWPWQPETLRGVVGTLALPIVIWLIQFGLGKVLR